MNEAINFKHQRGVPNGVHHGGVPLSTVNFKCVHLNTLGSLNILVCLLCEGASGMSASWTLNSPCSSRRSVYPTTQPSQEHISLITPPTTPLPQPEEKKTNRQRAKPVRTAKGTRRSTRLLGERKWYRYLNIVLTLIVTLSCFYHRVLLVSTVT